MISGIIVAMITGTLLVGNEFVPPLQTALADDVPAPPPAEINAPPGPISTLSGWKASYWSNFSQSGNPAIERTDAAVDFNWQNASPDPLLPFDGFSVHWTRTTTLLEGRFRVSVQVNGGVRVKIDNQTILDYRQNQGYQAINSYVNLTSGSHQIDIDYFDPGGQARIKVDVQRMLGLDAEQPIRVVKPNTSAPRLWQGEYFNNINLAGTPTYTEKYNVLDFDWGDKSPSLSINRDGFSARFTKRDYFNGGVYRFVVRADEGVRVFVDGKAIVNEWRTQRNRISQIRDVALTQGWHDLRVEYVDVQNSASLHVHWELQ